MAERCPGPGSPVPHRRDAAGRRPDVRRPGVLVVALLVAALAVACGRDSATGSDGPLDDDVDVAATAVEHLPPVAVDALDVVVLGDLDAEQAAMVDWALTRFHLAGLVLPAEIEVVFDPSTEACADRPGLCGPPNGTARALVCEPGGDTAFRVLERRLTLVHELAHLWHWVQGDGTTWPDRSAVVGGRAGPGDVAWEDRMVEHVAVVISWGVLDQLRRPVDLDVSCAELGEQFVALTGRAPLGPLEPICTPGS